MTCMVVARRAEAEDRARFLPETPEGSAEPLPRRESFFLLSLLQHAEGQLTLPTHDNMAKQRNAEQRAAQSRRQATWRKRVHAQAEAARPAEEMSERLKALYAVAPRIGPDGKPLPLADHTRRDEATRSRPSCVTTPPTSTPPPPDQAPATAGKVSLDSIARMMLGGVLTTEMRLKLRSDQLPDQPVISATTAPPVDFFAESRTLSTSTANARQTPQILTGSSASSVPLSGPEAAESEVGGFDTSFSHENINPTLADIQAGLESGSATEIAPPKPQIQDPTQESEESPLVPSASEHAASTPEMATERMLAEAMPHYDSGMQALSRLLHLIGDGGKKRR